MTEGGHRPDELAQIREGLGRLTNLRGAATRARVFIMGLACAIHWRTFGPRYEITIDDRTECSVDCIAVGGPYHCMCMEQPNGDYYDPKPLV